MGKVTRLKELEVEEVSIVDRPANKRKFLLVKNEVDMSDIEKGKEIVEDESGKLVTKEEAVDVTPEVEEQKLSDVFKATGEDLEKMLTIDPDKRKMVFQGLERAMCRLRTVCSTAYEAKSDEDGAKDSTLVPVLVAELMEVSKEIAQLGKKLGAVKKEEEVEKEDKKEDEEVQNLSTRLDTEKEEAETDRIEKFSGAVAKLSDLLNEPPKVDDSRLEEIGKHFENVTKHLAELSGIVKKQNKKIRELESVRSTSNVIPVEGDGRVKKAEGEVDWPLDMNNERTRENVDKSVSFF